MKRERERARERERERERYEERQREGERERKKICRVKLLHFVPLKCCQVSIGFVIFFQSLSDSPRCTTMVNFTKTFSLQILQKVWSFCICNKILNVCINRPTFYRNSSLVMALTKSTTQCFRLLKILNCRKSFNHEKVAQKWEKNKNDNLSISLSL